MSFGWSASSNPSFIGIKSASTNSFADALRRLAEHVEEKNKTNGNRSENSNVIQLSQDSPNRINSSHVNNSMSSEQALRLYTQYIQEAERREDMRRNYLRNYPGSDGFNTNLSGFNRRVDGSDPYRFMIPHLSGPLHPSVYFQSLTQQQQQQQPRMPLPSSSLLFPNIKTTDSITRVPTQDQTDEKVESTLQPSKPKLKLFRPYDLDSPTANSRQTSPSSPTSPIIPNNPSKLPHETQTTLSFGKEKQLFNSLGLVQQSTNVLAEKSSFIETSPSVTTSEESLSIDTILTPQQDNHPDKLLSNTNDSSLSSTIKRKSVFSSNTKQSSHRKQLKHETIHKIVE
ncbi:hypothetical protein I4U23_007431 [Adineta vaga]|nr:hypothetical protein I4U23_007431 [Adineta vaga]